MATALRSLLMTKKKISISNEMRTLLRGVWHDRLQPNAIGLTYLATRNFNVIRFPTRPDRSVDGQGQQFDVAVDLLDQYTDQQLDALCAELAEITRQTQEILRDTTGDADIVLQRAISPLNEDSQYMAANRAADPIELFPTLALAAQVAGVPSISFDVDIVSGWSTCATQRYGTLHLKRRWPIDDILLVSDLLDGPMEGDEWLCINRNPRGLMEFAIADLKLVGLPPHLLNRVNSNPYVQKLAAKLQSQANRTSADRTIAYRPTPIWWQSHHRLPKLTLREKLRIAFSFFAKH